MDVPLTTQKQHSSMFIDICVAIVACLLEVDILIKTATLYFHIHLKGTLSPCCVAKMVTQQITSRSTKAQKETTIAKTFLPMVTEFSIAKVCLYVNSLILLRCVNKQRHVKEKTVMQCECGLFLPKHEKKNTYLRQPISS